MAKIWSPIYGSFKGFPPTFLTWDNTEILQDVNKKLAKNLKENSNATFCFIQILIIIMFLRGAVFVQKKEVEICCNTISIRIYF